MRFIFFILLPVVVMAQSNSTIACFKDLVVLKNIGTEFILIYTTAGCNLLLLILNVTILYAVLGYMKPTISEIRKQTFIIMDNILLSYIPAKIRKILACPPEIISDEEKPTVGKGKKEKTKSPANSKSGTKSGTTKSGGTTGATAPASE